MKNIYTVGTNGLSGENDYEGRDPDDALMHAHRYERYLRLMKQNPRMLPGEGLFLAQDEIEMPDFRIDFCILKKSN